MSSLLNTIKHKSICSYVKNHRNKCDCSAKFNGKPFSHWQSEADRFVVDTLLRAVYNSQEPYSILAELAVRRLREIVEQENPTLVEELEEERVRCMKNVATALNSMIG